MPAKKIASKTTTKAKAKKSATARVATIQNSSFYTNASRTQRAVVIYTDGWTYVLDINNKTVTPPQPQQNQYTQFCQGLIEEGYVPGPQWKLPDNPPPRT